MSKVTKSRMFAHWIAENYPELRINSLEDNRGSNHRHGQAVDISGIDNHEDKKKILKTALDLGLRIGRENKGKKGVGGWTGAHYHFDETGYKGDTDVHFIRGGKSGHAKRKLRTKEENKENDIFKAEMLKLKHEPSTIDEKSFKKTYEPKVKEYFKLMKDFKKDPKKVQELVGTKADGKFGKNTMRAMIDHTIGYKPFPSELLKKDNLVMADKKGDSFFKKLVQQEAQKEIKEKKKSYDDMKFSDAFEEAMKDKGEGGVFKYKGKDILLKRAKPEIKKEPVKEKSYDDMKFSDAFEQAIKDKGEGKVFKYRGRDILLKRAKPKVEEKNPMDFQSLVKEYASKEIEPVEELDQEYNMDNIKDSQRVELLDRENELEKLLKQRAAFAHGGRKYQGGGFGESIEEPKKEGIPGMVIPESDKGKDETDDEFAKRHNVEDKYGNIEETESIDNKPTLRDPFAPKSPEAIETKEDFELAAEEDKTMVDTDPDVLPEEPEDKPEPLTMDTLEQRFKDLMKLSKKERQTAAWATAASQIASMIDRASANPIGIKPINFQAGDASAEAKELLALGKLKGLGADQGMTPYQRQSLDLRKKELGLKKGKEVRLTRKDKFMEELKDRLSDKEVREVSQMDDGIRIINDIDDLIKANEKELSKYLGFYGSGTENLKKYTPFEKNAKFVKLQQLVGTQLADYIKSISGAQVSEQEAQRLMNNIPNVGDKMSEFKVKLDVFRKEITKAREDHLRNVLLQKRGAQKFLDKGKKPSTESKKTYTDDMLKRAANKSFDGDLDKARKFYESRGYTKR